MKFTGILGSDNDKLIYAFMEGVKKHGYTDIIYYDYRDLEPYVKLPKRDVCVGYAARQLEAFKKLGEDIAVLELGYIRDPVDERKWISYAWNGLNGYADVINKQCPSDRKEKYFNNILKPENTNGEIILILTQVYHDQSLDKYGRENINYDKLIRDIRKVTTAPIFIKHHPKEWNPGIYNITEKVSYIDKHTPLEYIFPLCKATVSINSNSSVDSLIAGVPTITLDKGSMASSIAESNIDNINNIKLPGRDNWLNNLCYSQWLIEEAASGDVWDYMKQKFK